MIGAILYFVVCVFILGALAVIARAEMSDDY
jgi:hypothetical protein